MEAALIWASISGLAVALGFTISFIRSRRFHHIALGAAFIVPLLVVFTLGLSDGCALDAGGANCFGYGFGLLMAAVILPIWIILIIGGKWLKRRFYPRP